VLQCQVIVSLQCVTYACSSAQPDFSFPLNLPPKPASSPPPSPSSRAPARNSLDRVCTETPGHGTHTNLDQSGLLKLKLPKAKESSILKPNNCKTCAHVPAHSAGRAAIQGLTPETINRESTVNKGKYSHCFIHN